MRLHDHGLRVVRERERRVVDVLDADADRRVDGRAVRVDVHVVSDGRIGNDKELISPGKRGLERGGLREVSMPYLDARRLDNVGRAGGIV